MPPSIHEMQYDLFIGDRTFSSWSLRGWLMLHKFQIPHHLHMVGLYSGTLDRDLAPLAPARLVPVLRTPQGDIIGESLAMAETLAERHPKAGLWPADPALRARARWLCSEMATGFSALRSECPMQLAHVVQGVAPSPALMADLARLDQIWSAARQLAAPVAVGPWLFGRYSLADVFFAPVAARIIGYDLPIAAAHAGYVQAHITDPAFQTWRQAGLLRRYDPFPYYPTHATSPWPGDS